MAGEKLSNTKLTLEDVNKKLPTTNIKGKEYVEVNNRITAFRRLYPEGTILTEILSHDNGLVVMKATVLTPEGTVLATGHAFEKETSSYINKTSYIENCETSAVGRALGILGIGIGSSIASAEEVSNAIVQGESSKGNKSIPEPKATASFICERCGQPIGSIGGHSPSDVAKQTREKFGKQLCYDCGKAVKAEREKPTESVVKEEEAVLPFPIDE